MKAFLKQIDYSERWTSEWTSIIDVLKFNGSVKTLGYYRATVNADAVNEKYKLSRNEEFPKLVQNFFYHIWFKRCSFSRSNYIIKTNEMQPINTPWGLFSVQRLPFGVKFTPCLF